MLDEIWWWTKLALGIAAMVSLVPLIVWGGTSDWRHALFALRSYLKIMGWLVLIAGGFGLIVAGVEFFNLG